MKWGIILRLIIIVFTIAQVLGCSSIRPQPNSRRGLFDGDKEGYSYSQPRKSFYSSLVQTKFPRRKGRFAAPHVEHPFSFKWPLESVEVTSSFGQRGPHFHEGVDLRAKVGTPVFAAQTGVVLYADTRIGGYGKMIVVRHDGQVATIYAHNSKILVRRGDRVRKGQKIAMSGNTGHSTGPHLHFEVRRGLEAVNPLSLMPRLASASRVHTRKRAQGAKLYAYSK